jgi:hypothetical protein
MPHINELKESNFLKKEECGQGILVTIKGVSRENVSKQGAPEELKWCIHFEELEKPMVLNSTNAQLIAQIVKSEETDNWPRTKIVLYNDPSVSYAGKITGGIRVRAPRGKAAQPLPQPATKTQPAPAPVPTENLREDGDDFGDVPF